MDRVDEKTRSRIMSAVKSKDTKPEMIVRRLVHGMGYRYRLHRKDLPGKPDLVFASRKKIIFVHGCFWHRHFCRQGRSLPKVRRRFWRKKFDTNVARDRKNIRRLRKEGWGVLVIWSCQTKPQKMERLTKRIENFLGIY